MNKTDIVNDIKEIIEHSYLSKDEKLNFIKEELIKQGAYDE